MAFSKETSNTVDGLLQLASTCETFPAAQVTSGMAEPRRDETGGSIPSAQQNFTSRIKNKRKCTNGQLAAKKFPKYTKKGLLRQRQVADAWTEDETQRLVDFLENQVKLNPSSNYGVWVKAASTVGGTKNSKKCRQRWTKVLTKESAGWTAYEEERLIAYAKMFSNSWSKVAMQLHCEALECQIRWVMVHDSLRYDWSNEEKNTLEHTVAQFPSFQLVDWRAVSSELSTARKAKSPWVCKKKYQEVCSVRAEQFNTHVKLRSMGSLGPASNPQSSPTAGISMLLESKAILEEVGSRNSQEAKMPSANSLCRLLPFPSGGDIAPVLPVPQTLFPSKPDSSVTSQSPHPVGSRNLKNDASSAACMERIYHPDAQSTRLRTMPRTLPPLVHLQSKRAYSAGITAHASEILNGHSGTRGENSDSSNASSEEETANCTSCKSCNILQDPSGICEWCLFAHKEKGPLTATNHSTY